MTCPIITILFMTAVIKPTNTEGNYESVKRELLGWLLSILNISLILVQIKVIGLMSCKF